MRGKHSIRVWSGAGDAALVRVLVLELLLLLLEVMRCGDCLQSLESVALTAVVRVLAAAGLSVILTASSS